MMNRLSPWRLGVFLVLGLCLGLALAGSGSDASKDAPAPPAASKFEAFTFLHFGDPQMGFGKDGIAADKRRFLAVIREANERKPTFVFVAGDLVHDRTRQEYAALDEAMKAFRVPVKLTPGNHDILDHKTLKAYRAKFGKDYFVFTHNHCDFIFINSMLLSTNAPWFKDKDAAFRKEIDAQWQWLTKALADARAKQRTHVFLLTHVPPFCQREDEKAGYGSLPKDARARLLALARKHNVRAILAGHRHRNLEVKAAAPAIYLTGGTARVGDKRGFGYRVFHVHKDRIEQEFIPLKPDAKPAKAPAP